MINQVKDGDQGAFRQLVILYQQRVRNTVLGMLGEVAEVDDVAQEVFIRFYKSINEFREDAKLSTYLTRIAINLSLNELKRRKKKQLRIVSIFRRQPESETNGAMSIQDKSADLSRYDLQDAIQKGLQQLSEEFRAIIVLRLIEGYSVKDTSAILGIPGGTVASRLARAQQKLKEILKDYD